MAVSKAWKAREMQAARLFGGRRAPLSGSNGGITASDALDTGPVFVEQKHRASSPVFDWYLKAERLAKLEGKVPVVVLSKKYQPGLLLVMRPDDILTIAGQLQEARAQQVLLDEG